MIFKRFVIILHLFLTGHFVVAQNLEWKEKEVPSNVFDILLEKNYIDVRGNCLAGTNKALVVFHSSDEVIFGSSYDNLEQPSRFALSAKEFIYVLVVTARPQKLILTYNGADYKIPFSQAMEKNSLAALKENEIRFFELKSLYTLEYFNITESEKAKGNVGQPIGPNVSDALLVIKTFPDDLEIDILDFNERITKIQRTERGYSLFISTNGSSTNDVVLDVYTPELGKSKIYIYDLKSKELRFYLLKNPFFIQMSNNANVDGEQMNQTLKLLIGNWSGYVQNSSFFLHVEDVNYSNNTFSGIVVKDGIKFLFEGSLASLQNKSHHLVSIKTVEKDLYGDLTNFTLEFLFKNNILNGYFIDDEKYAFDLVLLQNPQPKNLDFDISLNEYIRNHKSITGTFSLLNSENSFIKAFVVEKYLSNNTTKGFVVLENDNILEFKSKLKFTRSGYEFSFVLDAPYKNDEVQCTVRLLYDQDYQIEVVRGRNRKQYFTLQKQTSKLRYRDVFPNRYAFFSKSIKNGFFEVTDFRESGAFNFDYELYCPYNMEPSFKFLLQNSNKKQKEFLDNYFQNLSLPSSTYAGRDFELFDNDRYAVSWQTNRHTIRHMANNSSVEIQRFNLPYGKYRASELSVLINEDAFYREHLIGYKVNGPINAINSLVIPGWGTRKVTYNEKNGWDRFAFVTVPLLVAFTTEMISRRYYNNYLSTEYPINSPEALRLYDYSNYYRRASLISAGVGLGFYLFEVSWVVNMGYKNLSTKRRVIKQLKSGPPIFLKNDL